jgi:transcriptional regulator with XRE-family HTH domain
VSEIGERVRLLRTAKHLTMGQLARSSGIGKATLSDLEAGRGNPTIETLFAVATVLDVPLSALLDDESSPSLQLVRSGAGRSVAGRGSRVHVRFVTRFQTGGATMEILDLEIRAKGHHHSEPHSKGVLERLLVHRGTLRVGPVSGPASLEPGDFLAFIADVPHIYAAEGEDVRATLLIQYPRT